MDQDQSLGRSSVFEPVSRSRERKESPPNSGIVGRVWLRKPKRTTPNDWFEKYSYFFVSLFITTEINHFENDGDSAELGSPSNPKLLTHGFYYLVLESNQSRHRMFFFLAWLFQLFHYNSSSNNRTHIWTLHGSYSHVSLWSSSDTDEEMPPISGITHQMVREQFVTKLPVINFASIL